VVQEVLFKEAHSLSNTIENIEIKMQEFYLSKEDDQIIMNGVAWFEEEKKKRALQRKLG
jgi:hypothetical protein